MKKSHNVGIFCLAILATLFVLGNTEETTEKKIIPTQLEIEVLLQPLDCKKKTKKNDLLHISYRGYLEDGTEFDSSVDGENPTIFKLGGNAVIGGWDEGLKEMCIGEKRKLTLPPRLAYGSQGYGKVPPKATVIFEVELLKIDATPTTQAAFLRFDLNGDGHLDMTELQTIMEQVVSSGKVPGLGLLSNEGMRNSMLQMLFVKVDKDRDSQLSPEEFSKIPGLNSVLQKDEL